MSAVSLATDRLKGEEGYRAKVYLDTRGLQTIGYGFNIQAGISEPAAATLLAAQVSEVAESLSHLWWFQGLDEIRASVLMDLAFNMGLSGLLHFPKMLAAIGTRNWQTAHDELLDSDAARELPARYQKLAQILFTGDLHGRSNTPGPAGSPVV